MQNVKNALQIAKRSAEIEDLESDEWIDQFVDESFMLIGKYNPEATYDQIEEAFVEELGLMMDGGSDE